MPSLNSISSKQSKFFIYILLCFTFLNPFLLNYIHLGLVWNVSKFSIISFYPIFFLPVFLEHTEKKSLTGTQFLLGICLSLFGLYTYSFAFFWLGGLLFCLSLSPYFHFKFHILGYILFLLSPPFSEKYTILIGFELRLFLSKLVGFILQILDSRTNVMGNIIVFKNQTFSVDPSCEGLKFFTGTIVLFLCFGFSFLKETKNQKKYYTLVIIGFFTLLLWIWANLIRIILLIYFFIPESSIFHYLIGAISFLTLIGFPFSLLWIQYINNKNSTSELKNNPHLIPNAKKKYPLTFKKASLSLFLAFGNTQIFRKWEITFARAGEGYINESNWNYPQLLLNLLPIILSFIILLRFRTVSYPDFFWKTNYGSFLIDTDEKSYESQFYRNKFATLILKKNLPLVGLGHHPKVCFEAVGYEFLEEEEVILNSSQSIRRAKIIKDKEQYFLSWWYIRDKEHYPLKRITSEWEWRKELLLERGEFLLINLITNSKEETNQIYKELAKEGL